MNVLRVAARYLTSGYHLFAAALKVGIPRGSAVIEPVVTDLFLCGRVQRKPSCPLRAKSGHLAVVSDYVLNGLRSTRLAHHAASG